jgi:hypothetical protein
MKFILRHRHKITLSLFLLWIMVIKIFIIKQEISKISDNNVEQVADKMIRFNFNKDLLVSIEIQKTGTTIFDYRIQTALMCIKENEWRLCCEEGCIIETETNKDIWYYSYHRSKKRECGIHPDYTALKHCISQLYPQKNLYYFTRIRNPIERYISEWRYNSQVGWWNIKSSKTFCKIKNDLCFDSGIKSRNITIEEFIDCPTNPGNNRMSRMLALYNYNNGECYGEGLSGEDMLERAKRTIDSLYWLGLNEYIEESVLLFEKTMSGSTKFEYFFFDATIGKKKTFANKYLAEFSDEIVNKIKENNHLDIQLYEYARENFFKRLNLYKIEIKKELSSD